MTHAKLEAMMTVKQGIAISDPTYHWPNSVVPYSVSSQFTDEGKATIANALSWFHK